MLEQIVFSHNVCDITQCFQKHPKINLQKQNLQSKRVIGNFDKLSARLKSSTIFNQNQQQILH